MLERAPRPSSIPKPPYPLTPQQTEETESNLTSLHTPNTSDLLEYSANVRIHKKVTKLRIRSSIIATYLIIHGIDIRKESFPRRLIIKTLRPYIKEYIKEYEAGDYPNFKGISGSITDKLLNKAMRYCNIEQKDYIEICNIVGATYADSKGKDEEEAKDLDFNEPDTE